MKAILQVSIVETDTRRAKVIRLFGIPIYHRNELDVTTLTKRYLRLFCDNAAVTSQEPKK